MLNILLNCLIVLGIIVTIYLIGIAFLFGGIVVVSIIGKLVEISKDDLNKKP